MEAVLIKGDLSHVPIAPRPRWVLDPVAWQDVDGRRVAVTVNFRKTSEREVSFALVLYDKARPLIIDPTLTWNTFLGGNSNDTGYGIAVDANGNVFVTGFSSATWGNPIRAIAGYSDAFVAKLDTNGVLL